VHWPQLPWHESPPLHWLIWTSVRKAIETWCQQHTHTHTTMLAGSHSYALVTAHAKVPTSFWAWCGTQTNTKAGSRILSQKWTVDRQGRKTILAQHAYRYVNYKQKSRVLLVILHRRQIVCSKPHLKLFYFPLQPSLAALLGDISPFLINSNHTPTLF
jgi:hypothetical protein